MNGNALLIDDRDNVAVALTDLEPRDTAQFTKSDGSSVIVTVKEYIPVYHKFAINDIRDNEVVLKYGEAIGTACGLIHAGQYVHLHNLRDSRGILMMEGLRNEV